MCIEFWTLRGYTEESARKIISEKQNKTSRNSFVVRYGSNLGNIKYQEYLDKRKKALNSRSSQQKQQSLDKRRITYQNKSDQEKYEIACKTKHTQHNYQLKYGDTWIEHWNSYVDLIYFRINNGERNEVKSNA